MENQSIKNSNNHKNPERKNIVEASYSKIAETITPYFLKTSLTPNHVTIISGVFGVIAAFLLISENYESLLLAGIFIQIFAILDLVDGDIARANNMQSYFGMWLDIFFDKLTDMLLIMGLATGAYIQSQDPRMLFLGMMLMGFNFFIQFIMLLNDNAFKKVRRSNENIVNAFELSDQKMIINPFIKTIMFFRNHLSLQHNTFLFLVSLFSILNMLVFGLIFITIHGLVSLVISILVNFYKIVD
jgi:phosphatidylglycerophosphate synthase